MPAKSEKKGPVAVVEFKSARVPIYLEPVRGTPSYKIVFREEGRRKRARFKSLELARKGALKKAEELNSGVAHLGSFSAAETNAILQAAAVLKPMGLTLTEAVQKLAGADRILGKLGGVGAIEEAAKTFASHKEKDAPAQISFGELYRKFMATLMTEEIPGDIESRIYHKSFRYWQDCSQRLGAAAIVFKDMKISAIKTRHLEEFLDQIPRRMRKGDVVVETGGTNKATGRTRNNYRGALCTIFSYARRLEYLKRGEPTEAEHVHVVAENKTKEDRARDLQRKIYTPGEMQKILDGLPTRWVVFAALGAFAGIRSAEIHRLDWRKVNLLERHITVNLTEAKVGKRRVIPISDQLAAWLGPFAAEATAFIAEQDSQAKKGLAPLPCPVCPRYAHDSTLGIEFAKARKTIDVPMVHNGHRHSHASYRLAETKNMREIAYEMNTSEEKLKENYLALVNDRELAAWKKVLPMKAKN